ncbi:MAG: hypothetical protein KBE65_13550 [Phycisphaerae bacterium]|nr:hypothetical protein [Phycisphaerae bacterium]
MNTGSVSTQWGQTAGPIWRYGMLALILGLLAWNLHSYFSLPARYRYDSYMNLVVVLMLLFNHLAFAFKWRRSITVALWTVAWSWIVFGLFYIFYWSRVLYPINIPTGN